MPQDLILEMKGISKSFPGVDVFKGFDFDLRKGEIHCVCGENGAGKSTLIKMLSGAHTPDAGEIIVDGKKSRQHITTVSDETRHTDDLPGARPISAASSI